MKHELRSKKWFLSTDGCIVQGLITKRRMLDVDDHDDGKCCKRDYFLRTDWNGPVWIDEEALFDTVDDLVKVLSIPCNFD